ncbi:MAG: RidA family protein [Alphaproteobacteria bacterium]|nr:RidA family protein [Alphaproteobacteria bacterium]
MSAIKKRLAELGFTLPPPAPAVALYVPYVVTGNLAFISGQIPLENGQVKLTGRLGAEVDLAAGQKAAQLCALNILAQLNKACGGDLDRVKRCVKLGGFVASAPDFFDHSKIINGASDVMQQVFGETGRHARFAVGVSTLPLNSAVEVDAVFEINPA